MKIASPLLIPFIFSIQSGNMNLCLAIADAESLSQNSRRRDFISINELARISFIARKYFTKQRKRIMIICQYLKNLKII
jgi:hypothetical protein